MRQMKITTHLAEVVSFNEDNYTAVVKITTGATVENVSVRSVINNGVTGVFVIPVVGSKVLVSSIDGRLDNMSIVLYSELKSWKVAATDELLLNGDKHGGIPQVAKIENNLNALKTAFESLIPMIVSAFNAVGVGSAANGPGAAQLFNTSAQSINIEFQQMENPKVKHG